MNDYEALQLWRYPQDEADRERVIKHFRPVVEKNVRSISGVRPADREDLRGAALLGLCQALSSYDDSYGYPLDRYLGLKVRYSVVDSLRSSSWARKGTRAEAKRLAGVIEELTAANAGTPPTDEEIAERLEFADVDELYRLRSKLHGVSWDVCSLEAPTVEGEGSHLNIADTIADQDAKTPEGEALMRERVAALGSLLDRLPERERQVLRGVYLDGVPQKELARRLGVHESRIAQLKDRALSMARSLAGQPKLELEEGRCDGG